MIRDRLLFAAAWALAFVQCATYVQSTPSTAAVAGGAGVLTGAGTSGGPSAGDAADVAGAVNATGGGGSAGAQDLPGAGASGSAAGGSAAGGSAAGGSAAGGSAAGASSGGTASDGGRGGSAGAATGGNAGATDKLLSLNQPATSDSEQIDHPAASGNDGSGTSRWCAANGSLGHYWQVDLGAAFALRKLTISWEKPALYQFMIEGSSNASAWSPLVDQTQSTNSSADQTYVVANGSVARYVRLTATGLPNANTWASFFELNVYGH